MIKATELRIGNWLLFIPTYDEFAPRYDQVSLNDLSMLQTNNPDCGYEAIPLTTEILKKCGFEKHEGYYWSKIEDNLIIDITFDSEYSWSIDGIGDSTGSTYREIKYLHQLQNLYFALTGEELEYKI